ncbi:MAG: hypothetical protein JO166_07610 [Deltaproteobacteria bacterium]|nr:hypothetical protein [Deltaproteobacteria bacterium]
MIHRSNGWRPRSKTIRWICGFEGVIPSGEYGGGTVMVWDKGAWLPEVPNVGEALNEGELKFSLEGKKLKSPWVLVRTRGFGRNDRPSWPLIKHRDPLASKRDITLNAPRSVVTNRTLAEIARDCGGDIARAATGDPPDAST